MTLPPSIPASPWASGSSSPGGSWTVTAGRVPGTLVEVWQATAGGRYRHDGDRHPAALDPNFSKGVVCDRRRGRWRFVTVKPGAHPWKNHHNARRPAHIHFSVFGRAFVQRLITQMYFPGDPCSPSTRSFSRCRRGRGGGWCRGWTWTPRWRGGPWGTGGISSCGAARRTPLEDEDDDP